MAEVTRRGQIVWHELMTTDPKAAEAFYTAAAGWTTAPFEGIACPTRCGCAARCRGRPDGPHGAGAPGRRAPLLAHVRRHAGRGATVREAQALGGRVLVPPMDIPNVAGSRCSPTRRARCSRPTRPPTVAGSGRATPCRQFSWHELATSDSEAALAFYGALFGWAVTRTEDLGALGLYRMFGSGGFTLARVDHAARHGRAAQLAPLRTRRRHRARGR